MMPLGFCSKFCSRALQISQYCVPVLMYMQGKETTVASSHSFISLNPTAYGMRWFSMRFLQFFYRIKRVGWSDEERCYTTDFGETDYVRNIVISSHTFTTAQPPDAVVFNAFPTIFLQSKRCFE